MFDCVINYKQKIHEVTDWSLEAHYTEDFFCFYAIKIILKVNILVLCESNYGCIWSREQTTDDIPFYWQCSCILDLSTFTDMHISRAILMFPIALCKYSLPHVFAHCFTFPDVNVSPLWRVNFPIFSLLHRSTTVVGLSVALLRYLLLF